MLRRARRVCGIMGACMIEHFGELESIQFGQGDDARVILTGRSIPFRFGKVCRLQYVGGQLHILVKPDPFTEKAMEVDADNRRSLFKKVLRAALKRWRKPC